MGERRIELNYEGCVIVLHKPQLTERERAKREREVVRAMTSLMAEVQRRKEGKQ